MNAILCSLLVASILLAGGLLLQRFAARASAAKYAVLLWTLVAVALCPGVMVAMRAAGIRPLVTIVNTHAFDPTGSQILALVPRNENPGANVTVPWTAILLGIWTAGLIGSLSRLASGLHSVRLLRRTASPLHPDRIRSGSDPWPRPSNSSSCASLLLSSPRNAWAFPWRSDISSRPSCFRSPSPNASITHNLLRCSCTSGPMLSAVTPWWAYSSGLWLRLCGFTLSSISRIAGSIAFARKSAITTRSESPRRPPTRQRCWRLPNHSHRRPECDSLLACANRRSVCTIAWPDCWTQGGPI